MAGARHKFNELEVEMIDINELRRLAQAATPGPWKLLPVGDKSKCFAVADINFLSVLTVVDECGTSFGAVYLDGDAKFIAAANPAAVSELLDRLEAAKSDALEQARLNGMGASREAALLAKLEAAEKDRANFLVEMGRLCAQCDAAERERDECNRRRLEAADHFAAQTALMKKKYDAMRAELDALLAWKEEAERQEPVGEVVLFGERLKEISWRKGKLPDVGTKLYARPVPAQSVPGTQAALDVLAERRG